MRHELNVLYWKIKGVPLLGNMHQKTGMTEVLTKYAEACKKKLDLDGKQKRQDALKNVKAKLHKLKHDYPERGNPLLWRSYIKPVDAALPREVQDFNDALARFQTQLAKSTNIEHYKAAMDMKVSGYAIGSAFWEAVKAEGGERLAFLASIAVKKDPRWIATNFIQEKAPHQINLSGDTRQKVWAAVNATPTHAAFTPAVPEVCRDLVRNHFAGFRSTFELRLT